MNLNFNLAIAVSLIASFTCPPAFAAMPELHSKPLPEQVRAANDRFVDVAEAIKEGYAPIPCTSGPDGGAMGIHYVNGDLIKAGEVAIDKPEAVMYEPGPDGKLRLVAVEYITTKGPANLDGQLFSYTGSPNRYGLPSYYELHVWAWKANPKGPFADMNPEVSCEFAPAMSMSN